MTTDAPDITTTEDAPPLVEMTDTTDASTDHAETVREVYRRRLAGEKVEDLAEEFGVHRRTVWRWCKMHEEQARQELEDTPRMTIISEEIAKFQADERNYRQRAQDADNEKTRIEYLKLAGRAQADRIALLFKAGVLESAPEKLFQAVATVNPDAMTKETEVAERGFSENLTLDEQRELLRLQAKSFVPIEDRVAARKAAEEGLPTPALSGPKDEIDEALIRLRRMRTG